MTPATTDDLRMLLGFFPFVLLTLALESRFTRGSKMTRRLEDWFFSITLATAGVGIVVILFSLGMPSQTPASFKVLIWWLAIGAAFGAIFTLAIAYVSRRDAEA
ncbi:hypothetical protein [Microbacterium sp. P02]|uniref:hypothetical protein n=1 Tax=Microbacterium sp. P02 TaxID=3366260 RepID=UPI00366DAA8D